MRKWIVAILLLIPIVASQAAIKFRSIDGSDNTPGGEPGDILIRLSGNGYIDGDPDDSGPSPRLVSNFVSAQGDVDMPNGLGASDMVWQWGQFLDHDIDLTEAAHPTEAFDILVPTGDPFFDPRETGTQIIPFSRSIFEVGTDGVRQQLNEITSFVDGSQVYGSDYKRAAELRTNDGTGMLKTSKGNLLPFNDNLFPNADPFNLGKDNFLAGDVRANEQVGLTALHTLFVREHNYWARRIKKLKPFKKASGDKIYNLARVIVTAELQMITYEEFLPVILGVRIGGDFDEFPDPGIANEFSTAAFRFGHSMLSPTLMRLDKNLRTIRAGNLSLKDAFFNPKIIIEDGIEPILRGLSCQHSQEVDTLLVDGVRNFLFGAPGSGGFDLASLNIQRGRDHGLPKYNEVRWALGFEPVDSFLELTGGDEATAMGLFMAYEDVDDVDLWVGGLSEPHVEGAMVGELFQYIIGNQFKRLRDADMFWYEDQLKDFPIIRKLIRSTSLSTIIKRNTKISWELQNDVFMVPDKFRRDRGRGRGNGNGRSRGRGRR